MIWYYIITFLANISSSIFGAFHIPRVDTLPLGMDEALSTGVGYFKEFMGLFPPLAILFNAVMFYLAFKLILLILKNIPVFRITTK